MSLTHEEAIKRIDVLKSRCERLGEKGLREWKMDAEACDLVLTTPRPVSRDQVEKVWRAHWNESTQLGGFVYCSRCGYNALEANNYTFCPKCGSPFTDEAVEMVMERLEALKDAKR